MNHSNLSLFKSTLYFEFLTAQARRPTVNQHTPKREPLQCTSNERVCLKVWGSGFVQELCGCADDLPKPVKDVFDNCKNSIYPDGFGSCSDGTLLKSEDDKTKFEECFIKKLPQYKSLDSSEDQAQENFMKCIYKNGNKCLQS
ncbi:uncharacterized protein TNIN_69941 [Trichonephila inaurata madagascariensis]|uniref:Uncharacterized protein n=1 Tax=Trichonephila inaurata madagascariensis TaxID=2747483 RepID=A0A8X6XZI7_9ARAC|nr:uncharacterized protein TNIN_69941 [Trichonephila inaurata madagascariensis]